MKLFRFGEQGSERPGVVDGSGVLRDGSSLFKDWDATFWNGGGVASLANQFDDIGALPEVGGHVRIGPCVPRPGKIVCIGLNYHDHARESGMPIPDQPIVFMKAANTISGPFDDVHIPRGGDKTDWEVELAIIIGRVSRYLENEAAAESCIAGYAVLNDVSERAFQLEHGGQWTKGKSCDTFSPLGPYLVTADEVPDVCDLAMSLKVNGQTAQQSNSSQMIFKPAFLVHYLSHFMTLEPGDVISTGTPPGVGMGMKPPRYLKEGDVMELEVEGLGMQRQTCVQA